MSEDQEFTPQQQVKTDQALLRMAGAIDQLEEQLGRTLSEQKAMQEKYRILRQEHDALLRKTESVGGQLDETIGRLKLVLLNNRPAAGSVAHGDSEWAKSQSR